jgi:uncharacterized protein (TIGR02266 family)
MSQPSSQGKDGHMFPLASRETYEDGQIIIEEGSSGDWIYVVLSGSVEIFKIIDGKRFTLSVLKPGEVFGELGYLGAVKRTATARAIGETTLGILDRVFLDKEFNKLSGYFRTILVAVVKRFRGMMDRATEFTSRKEKRAQKTLSLMFKDHQSFIKAYTVDIGEGGLFISTEHLLKEGEQFLLKLQLPGLSEPLKVECEVVWTRKQSDTEERPSGMGVKFCEMSKKDIQVLNHYLQL